MYNEKFLKQYNSEKIKSWNNDYINYINLINQITNIIENKNILNQMNPELKEEEEKEEEEENILINKDEPNKIENILEIDNNYLNSNQNNISITKKMEKKYKKQTKIFMSILDNEIKKIHKFYLSKETLLFEGINAQISSFNNLNKDNNNENKDEDNNKTIEIITELNYFSKLAKSLINYVYLNIKALKEILNTYDRKVIYISYKYIKKHLSKSNGDLVYILNFKILDEIIIAIQDLFELVQDKLNKAKYFKNNKKKEKEFDDINEQIIDNIQDIEEIHDKIFEELTKWEKHLNMSLGLPSSSYHSIFKETSFIGDSIPLPSEKSRKRFDQIKKQRKVKKNTINLIEKENKTNKVDNITKVNENDFMNEKISNNIIENNNDKDKDLLEKNKEIGIEDIDNEEDLERGSFASSELFANSEVYSYDTKKVLNKQSITNLHILLPLILFYSFSINYLIPNIIIILSQDIKDKDNYGDYIYLFGIIISVPYIGNMIAKIILKYFFNKAFKVILALSLFFIFSYYTLLLIAMFYKQIFLIIIGRFLLGFSILSHLSKIYVDNYIPLTTQIKSNQRHTFYINIGYFFGFLLNVLHFLDIKQISCFYIVKFKFNIFKITIILCLIFSLAMLIVIIVHFHEPTKYSLLSESLLKMSQKHRLSKGFLTNISLKIDAEKIDKQYNNINNSFSSLGSKLTLFVKSHLKKNYYRKIKFILIIFFISIEYTRENLIIFIPILISYNIENIKNGSNDYILLFGPCIISFSFLFSYLLQAINLEKKRIQKKKIKILIIILFLLLIFNICFYFIIFPKDLIESYPFLLLVLIPSIGIFCMIILNELFYIIVINLFIKLLPSEKIKFCCFKLSFAINFVTKIVRIIPSLIILTFYIISNNNFYEYSLLYEKPKIRALKSGVIINYLYIILFGIQIFNLLFSLLLLICNTSALKNKSRNRLLFQ